MPATEKTVRVLADHTVGLATMPLECSPGNPLHAVWSSMKGKYNAVNLSRVPEDERFIDLTRGELVALVNGLREFYDSEIRDIRTPGCTPILEPYAVPGVRAHINQLQTILKNWDDTPHN